MCKWGMVNPLDVGSLTNTNIMTGQGWSLISRIWGESKCERLGDEN